ncbi:MAG: hypothetical protein KF678_03600 [Phycisphaeraceae bacterium]|nr:hypothetical protein [Phycisphaeraceae bacterium]
MQRPVETDYDTSGFEQEFLVLYTRDDVMSAAGDDNFAVYSVHSAAGPVPDGQPNDRTRRASIEGDTRVDLEYTVFHECPASGAPEAVKVTRSLFRPLNHQLAPEVDRPLRELTLRVHVHLEPFLDVGIEPPGGGPPFGIGDGRFNFHNLPGGTPDVHDLGEPSEPYLDLSSWDGDPASMPPYRSGDHSLTLDARGPVVSVTQIQAEFERARLSWQCAGVRISYTFTPAVAAPTVDGIDILSDGWFDSTSVTERDAMLASLAGATHSTLELVFSGHTPGGYGLCLGPFDNLPAPFSENTYAFIGPRVDANLRTLAHEIGHALDNGPDSPNPLYILYPADDTYSDTSVNRSRRLTPQTIVRSRTLRPAGNLTATGNRLLTTP